MAVVKLKLYKAALRHGGELGHEVPVGDREGGVSEREIRWLRHIHGSENIVHVQQVGEREFDEQEHYFEIAEKYGSHEDFTRQTFVRKRVEALFHVELDGFDAWLDQKVGDQRRDVTFAKVGTGSVDEAAMRSQIEAQVRAEIAAKLGVPVSELDSLKPSAVPVAQAA